MILSLGHPVARRRRRKKSSGMTQTIFPGAQGDQKTRKLDGGIGEEEEEEENQPRRKRKKKKGKHRIQIPWTIFPVLLSHQQSVATSMWPKIMANLGRQPVPRQDLFDPPPPPTSNGGMQKRKLSRNAHALHARFSHVPRPISRARSALIDEICRIGAQSEVD